MDSTRKSGAAEIDSFLEANLFSFAAWDLIVCLADDPIALQSTSELAAAVARREYEIEGAIRRLVVNGVVSESVDDDGVHRFCLTADSDVRRLVARFAVLTSVRESRLELVRRVLSRLSVR